VYQDVVKPDRQENRVGRNQWTVRTRCHRWKFSASVGGILIPTMSCLSLSCRSPGEVICQGTSGLRISIIDESATTFEALRTPLDRCILLWRKRLQRQVLLLAE
jgi:hypothetical protein